MDNNNQQKTKARLLAEKAMEIAQERAAKSGRTVMEEAREMQYDLEQFIEKKKKQTQSNNK